ncbi:zinc-ribbon domain-containing protein, partial [Elioraea sp.]|uniref:zinc-ribbon domain-containing protein n=1 Tax=Elioraea sp. TaxID=2185103 RepID=UPI0038D186F1
MPAPAGAAGMRARNSTKPTAGAAASMTAARARRRTRRRREGERCDIGGPARLVVTGPRGRVAGFGEAGTPGRRGARTGLARPGWLGDTWPPSRPQSARRIASMPRIACPSCGARYDVAAGMIGPAGKSVRCARCGHVWLARAEGEAPAEPPAQWPEPP